MTLIGGKPEAYVRGIYWHESCSDSTNHANYPLGMRVATVTLKWEMLRSGDSCNSGTVNVRNNGKL